MNPEQPDVHRGPLEAARAMRRRTGFSYLDSALERVSSMLGVTLEWMEIRDFLPPHASPELKRSALASSFVAALELAKRGTAELDQDGTFAPLRIRRLKQGVAA